MTTALIGRGRMGKGLFRRLVDAGLPAVLLGRGESVPADTRIAMLAVPHAEADAALKAAGDLDGRILVDLTNPLGEALALTIGHTTSAAEEIQKRLPRVAVVKAFNTLFAELLELDLGKVPRPPQVPYAGDDPAAKAEVAGLIAAIGYEPFDCGPLKTARYLEPMAALIVDMGYGQGRGTRIAPRLESF